MTVKPGGITALGLGGYLPTIADWPPELLGFDPLDYLLLPPDYHDSVKTAWTMSQSRVIVNPSVHVLPRAAVITRHYVDDYYYRIHIIPTALDLGNLLSVQERDIFIWNAYFVAKTLESVTKENAGGIAITEPEAPPTVFAPLEERNYIVSISLDGPADIDAQILFAFTGENILVLLIIGSRIVLFPWVPNWEFIEKLSWFTDVLKTRQGEQRIALRDAPRQAYSFQFWLDEQQFTAAKIMADKWNYRVWGLPVWIESAITSANIGATEIVFDTTNADWREGGLGAFRASDTDFEIFEVVSIVTNQITIKLPLAKAWNNAHIFPVRLARTPEGIEFGHPVNNRIYNEMTADFLVEDSVYLGESDFALYDGYEVYEDTNARVSAISERIRLPQVEFDNGQGPVAYEQTCDYSDFAMTLGKMAEGKADTWRWRQWLHSRKGRQKPFLLPSWNRDLMPIEPITGSGIILICKATNLPLYGEFPLRVRIEMKSGVIYYRKIIGAESGDPGKENVFLDECLGVAYNPEDFKWVSYLYLTRLNTDTVEIKYYGYMYNKTSLPIMRVPA